MAQNNADAGPNHPPSQAEPCDPDGRVRGERANPIQTAPQGGDHPQKAESNTNPPQSHWLRWTVIGIVAVILLAVGLIFGVPWIVNYFKTVSTDDAFVSGHVSMISPRVGGYVKAIYVDNNQRVRKNALLLELDPRPYQVVVDQRKAALAVAEANLNSVVAQAKGQEAQARAAWFSLINAQEQVRYQIATLRSNVANLKVQQAKLGLAQKRG